MAKRPAASMKPVKGDKKETPDCAKEFDYEKHFNDAISAMTLLMKTKKRLMPRADTWISAYKELKDLDIPFEINDVEDVIASMDSTLDSMLSIIGKLKIDDFKKRDMDDPFKDLVPRWVAGDSAIKQANRYMRYMMIRPFGEKIEQLHALVVEEMEKRGELDD